MSEHALKSTTSNVRMMNTLYMAFGDTPGKRKQLLDGINIAPRNLSKQYAQISTYEELLFLGNVSKLKGEDWVWRHMELWQADAAGNLGKAVLNAPDCAEAINIITRFGYHWSSNLYFEHFQETIADQPYHIMALGLVTDVNAVTVGAKNFRDIAMLKTYFLLDRILNKSWTRAVIRFTGEPDFSLKNHGRVFHCPVETSQSRNGFYIPEVLCNQPSELSNKAAYKRYVYALFQQLDVTNKDDAFRQRVENQLSATAEGRPSALQVAASLGVSQRTLNRHLRESGTTFRELLEQSLIRRANKLLATKTLSRAQISERLGFNDQASFSRALKRWKHSERPS